MTTLMGLIFAGLNFAVKLIREIKILRGLIFADEEFPDFSQGFNFADWGTN